MRVAALVVLCGACLSAQQAELEGIAVNALTGEPLSGMHVRLFTGAYDAVDAIYGAQSDAAGHFAIAGIEPGSYRLTPERRGFIYLGKSGGTFPGVILKPGERITAFKLEMTPRAVIAGRLLDDYGDPVQHVTVEAEAVSKYGQPVGVLRENRATTDDRGGFRISGAPGKYRIKATPMRMGGDENEIRSDGTSAAPFIPTYYPSAPAADRASVVEAAPGSETSGIEIRLLRGPKGLTISGVVSGLPENGFANVMLQSGESAQLVLGSQPRNIDRDGKFSFRNLEPRFYRIFAQSFSGKTPLRSQMLELNLHSADVTNLDLVLAPGGELAGTLEIAGSSAGKGTVRLEPAAGTFAMVRPAEVDKEGGFRINDLLPGKYQVRVDGLADDAYIKTIQLDGAAVADNLLDLSRGAHGSHVKITVSLNGGRLGGSLLDKNGERLIRTIATVYLMKDPEQASSQQVARVTPEGQYSFHGIRPGTYRMFAVDMFRSGPVNTPESMKKLFAAAEEIEIKEGDRITKDVKVAPVQEGDAEKE